MPLKPAVTYTPEEVEKTRLEQLAAAAEERETTPEELAADFAPGTFGCHEALQMASVFNDSVERHLADHPSILTNPEWYALAHEAGLALWNLYQAIGGEHLRGDGDGQAEEAAP
ncbi:hypothetical protein KHC28_11280 [Ancylobacter sonchi]|uniref:hypothetical protein n=1 Tax=Ancylobacter sonchi TaxID=1937790 RepID=UPI001BD64DEE|nr:hypothetical protein [Ancylobacter sonchi]MBS7534240.1 hypothetical protein [Ancylobacter sonchi]